MKKDPTADTGDSIGRRIIIIYTEIHTTVSGDSSCNLFPRIKVDVKLYNDNRREETLNVESKTNGVFPKAKKNEFQGRGTVFFINERGNLPQKIPHSNRLRTKTKKASSRSPFKVTHVGFVFIHKQSH